MTPKLYISKICPPGRSVMMTADMLDITLEVKELSLNDNTTKHVLKHSLPILEDNHFRLWDSHAIIAYLIGKYGNNESLYPKNKEIKSIIDERLHFDSGVLSFFTETILNPIIHGDKTAVKTIQDYQENLIQTYDIVENFFKTNKWISGEHLTIADLCLIPSITSLNIIKTIDPIKYPKTINWIKMAENLRCYRLNEIGLNILKEVIDSKIHI